MKKDGHQNLKIWFQIVVPAVWYLFERLTLPLLRRLIDPPSIDVYLSCTHHRLIFRWSRFVYFRRFLIPVPSVLSRDVPCLIDCSQTFEKTVWTRKRGDCVDCHVECHCFEYWGWTLLLRYRSRWHRRFATWRKKRGFDCWKSEKNGLNKRKALGPL